MCCACGQRRGTRTTASRHDENKQNFRHKLCPSCPPKPPPTATARAQERADAFRFASMCTDTHLGTLTHRATSQGPVPSKQVLNAGAELLGRLCRDGEGYPADEALGGVLRVAELAGTYELSRDEIRRQGGCARVRDHPDACQCERNEPSQVRQGMPGGSRRSGGEGKQEESHDRWTEGEVMTVMGEKH